MMMKQHNKDRSPVVEVVANVSPLPLIAASISLADTILFLKYSLDHFLGGDIGKVGKTFQGRAFFPPLVSPPVVVLPPVGEGDGSGMVAERVSGRVCLSIKAFRETLVMPVDRWVRGY